MSIGLRALLGPIFSGAIGEVTDVLAAEAALAEQRTHALSKAASAVGRIDPESLVENGFVTLLEGNTGYEALHEMLKSPLFKPIAPFRVGLATTPISTEYPGEIGCGESRKDVTRDPFAIHVGVIGIRGLWRCWDPPPADAAATGAIEKYSDRHASYHGGAKPRPNLLLDFQGALSNAIPPFSNRVDWDVLQGKITAAGGMNSLPDIALRYERSFVHAALADPVLKLLAGALALAHRDYEVVLDNPDDNRKYNHRSRRLPLTFTAKAERAERLQREYNQNAIIFLITLIRSQPSPERLNVLEKVAGMINDESNAEDLDQALVELCIVAPHRVSPETEKKISNIMDYLFISRTDSYQSLKGTQNQNPNPKRVLQALQSIIQKTGKWDYIVSRRSGAWYDDSYNSGRGWKIE